MKLLRAWMSRLAGMLPNARRERELADEIEGHLQMHIDDNLRAGMSPEQARREAIWKLGGVESTVEAYRERSTMPFLENLLQDARFAVRQLRKNPGFTATAVLMLALGMCASVAIFAFVDAALIKPLPYANPRKLVAVFETTAGCPLCNVSYLNFRDWKKDDKLFASLDVWGFANYLLRTPTGAQPAQGTRVSDGFFRTLGVTPVLGRDFYAGEDLPARASHRAAQLCGLAEPLRRQPERGGTGGQPQRRFVHHRRRAAADVSIRSPRSGGILGAAERSQFPGRL